MAAAILLSLSLSLLFSHGSIAQIFPGGPGFQQQQGQPQQRFRQQTECRLQSISSHQPNREAQAEAGRIEYFDENEDDLDCAGVAVLRYTIQPNGLLVPAFANAPRLAYIVQGEGLTGAIIPGCPESYLSPQSRQSEERQSEQFNDQHQKVRRFEKGDIHALPAGVAHWCYNSGKEDAIVLVFFDTSNAANQLEQNLRGFYLAGARQIGGQQQQQEQAKCIVSGFDSELLADALGVSRETARKLQQCEDYERGPIIRVENGLRVATPSSSEEEEGQGQRRMNGLEETLCNARLRENIDRPFRADIYNPRAGRISSLNSHKLPILNYLQLSAERGVLYRDALLAPHWHVNAHSVLYCTRGNARIQMVGNEGKAVFDGQLNEGELLVVPQAFVVVIRAGNEGFEYVAFKTNDNAVTSPVVGQTSVFRALPEDVLVNSYRITRDEARRLKRNRGREPTLMVSRSRAEEERQGVLLPELP